MRQRWRDLLFLHWELPAHEIQATLPPGLHVDTHEERAYVGVVPFFMEEIRFRCLPALPGTSKFQELNLRTYVYDDAGIPGVWFYTLDACNRLAVAVAKRFFNLPYRYARMRAELGRQVVYGSKAIGDDNTCRFVYDRPDLAGEECAPDSLDFFLIERYCLFAFDSRRRRLLRGDVRHPPYRIQRAELARYDTHLFSASPLHGPSAPPVHAVVASAVDVTIFPVGEIARFPEGRGK